MLAAAVQRHRAGDLAEAVRLYREIVAAEPNFAEPYHFLGLAAYQSSQYDAAAGLFETVVKLEPNAAESWHNLGLTRLAQDRIDDADRAFRRTLQLQPDHAETFGHLARLNEERNRLDDAAKWVEKGLAVAPQNGLIALIAARLDRRAGRTEEAIARLQSLRTEAMEPAIRDKIAYELGRLCDRAGQYDQAWDYFADANRLAAGKWSARNAPKEHYLAEIDTLEARFTPDWVAKWTPPPPPPAQGTPIFMVGFPRSGTTLLDQMLDSHPALATLEEAPTAAAMIDVIARLPGGFPDALAAMTPADIESVRTAYFGVVDQRITVPEGVRLVDKLPLNMVQAGLIHRIFPEAPFIVSLRHPCDVCLSCFMQDFAVTTAMANFFTIEDAAHLYDRALTLWTRYRDLLPLKVHALRYEDLVDDPEVAARHLLEFLELPWDDAVLDHAGRATARPRIATPSYHQVAEPIYRRSRYRWRHYEAHLKSALDTLAPWIEAFGYADPDE